MAFLIGGANSAADTGYDVANSCRFNDGDSAYMSRTLGTPTDPEKWTWSCWVKRSTLGATQDFMSYDSGSTLQENFAFDGDDNLRWYHRTSGGTAYHLKTNKKFRDVSAFYHLLIVYDSSQATASNRVKFFVNGTQETSFATSDYPAQDVDSELNKANAISLYRWAGGSEYFDGYIAENVFCDGQAYTTTNFGEFDEDSPTIWKPIDVSGLTFGTNGFYLDFEDSANLGNDANGGTDWSETNVAATDQTTDTPTNNFCTLNPLTNSEVGNAPTFAEGNCKITMANFDTESVMATMGVTAGKWYWEIKDGWKTGNWGFGIEKGSSSNIGLNVGYTATSYSFSQNGYKQNNSSASQIDSGLSDGDIIGYALDLDNGHFNFSQNGVWYNGSASESTTFDTDNHDFTSLDFGSEFVMPTISGFADTSITTEINFGNPSYANTSSNADGNGYGDFEYPPPSGYLALCTKNLGSDGG